MVIQILEDVGVFRGIDVFGEEKWNVGRVFQGEVIEEICVKVEIVFGYFGVYFVQDMEQQIFWIGGVNVGMQKVYFNQFFLVYYFFY